VIDESEAIRIASEDAVRVYRDLEETYRPEATSLPDGWKVEFVLRNAYSCGGGAIYEIEADGSIRSRRYYQ
jgi:hypothetical protein